MKHANIHIFDKDEGHSMTVMLYGGDDDTPNRIIDQVQHAADAGLTPARLAANIVIAAEAQGVAELYPCEFEDNSGRVDWFIHVRHGNGNVWVYVNGDLRLKIFS